MFSERTLLYLSDVVDDSTRLANFVEGLTLDQFIADDRTRLAVERLFQRITEAVIQIGPDDMAKVGADIPVGRIRAFGNRLRHDYRAIDPALLLSTAREDLPVLVAACAAVLHEDPNA
jgi:uncharacterized protein with HEPN domain